MVLGVAEVSEAALAFWFWSSIMRSGWDELGNAGVGFDPACPFGTIRLGNIIWADPKLANEVDEWKAFAAMAC